MKLKPYLQIETPVMTEMFNEYLYAFESRFGTLTSEQKDLLEIAFKTGIGRGVTNNCNEADHHELLVETLVFSKHQVATSGEKESVIESVH